MRSADRRAAALASSPASSPPAGRELRWLAAILLAAAALRVVAWWRTAVLFDDGPIFLYIAEAIGEGDWSSALAHPYHPLYPLLTWLAKGVAGTLEGGAVLVSVVAGTASVAALWAFLRAAFDPRTALVGAALIAVHPNALAFSSDVQSDGLYVALFLGGVALLWRALDGARPELAGWAGLAAGLAYLTRPEGLGVVLVGSALAALRVGSGRWQLGFTARWLAALGLGVAIAIAPYVVALRVETGHWLITQKMSPAAGADDSVRAESPARVLPRPTAGARVRPERDLAGASSALRDLYRSTAAGFRFEYAGLVILGLWAARRGPRRRDRGLFLGFFVLLYGAVLFTLAFGAGYVSRRHTLPPLLPLLGYAALGTVLVGGWATAGLARLGFAPARANRGGVGRGGLAVVLGLALVAFLSLPRDLRERRPEKRAERMAAEWLRDSGTQPGPVAAARLRVAYYAGATYVPLPEDYQDGILGYLRHHDVRYVVVDEARMDRDPALRDARDRGLRPLHRARAGGQSVVVFEVLTEEPPPAAASM